MVCGTCSVPSTVGSTFINVPHVMYVCIGVHSCVHVHVPSKVQTRTKIKKKIVLCFQRVPKFN